MKKIISIILVSICLGMPAFAEEAVSTPPAPESTQNTTTVAESNTDSVVADEAQACDFTFSLELAALCAAGTALLALIVITIVLSLKVRSLREDYTTERNKRHNGDEDLRQTIVSEREIVKIAQKEAEAAVMEYERIQELKKAQAVQAAVVEAPVVEESAAEVEAPIKEEVFYGEFSPNYNGFEKSNVSEEKTPAAIFRIVVKSPGYATYQLVENVAPMMLNSALNALDYNGDTQKFSSIVPQREGELSYNEDGEYWMIDRKAEVLFKA